MSAASDELGSRIRSHLAGNPGLTERRMFGGVCFMLDGNMLCGAMKGGTMLLRVGPERFEAALQRPGAIPMTMG